jgi:hypothetical protein
LNVYVAPNSFKDNSSREAINAKLSRSIFIDIDIGPEKNYPDKPSALSAIKKFVDDYNLPMPVLVDSGGGWHVYWIFNQDIPIKEWQNCAEQFKLFCRDKINIDPVCTAEAARVMRCPTTINHKYNLRADILSPEILTHDFEEFKKIFWIDGIDWDTKKVAENTTKDPDSTGDHSTHEFAEIAGKSLRGEGCNQIKKIIEDRATLLEPSWRAGLSIAQHCVDRDEAIHAMSNGHPRYNEAETEEKATATQDKPYSCKAFEDLNPPGCVGCKFKGKITNPLALSVVKKVLPPPVVHSNALPEELKPYYRTPKGEIVCRSMDGEDTLISEYDIYPIRRIVNGSEGDCLLMRYMTPWDGAREFQIPIKAATNVADLKDVVYPYGLIFESLASAGGFLNYFIKWAKYFQAKEKAEQMRKQMGWTEDQDAFVIGEKEYKRDGTNVRASSDDLIRSMSNLLIPSGDYGTWKKAANELDRPEFELHAFAMLCGFGSPLMRFTSTPGVSMGLVGDSGAGKTGALYAALSVFGNPHNLCLAGGKEQATANGLIGWFMGLKNIMLGLDESSNRTKEDLSNLIYQVSQGKGKIRMRSNVNAPRDLEQSCSLICMFTGNQAIVDKLKDLKDSPDGELARLVELPLKKPTFLNNEIGLDIFDKFRTNYGHAGPEFIRELFKLGEVGVKQIVEKWQNKFVAAFGDESKYRFYANLIGVTFAGGEIANNAGIINMDLNRIYTAVISEVLKLKVSATINSMDPEDLLGEFQNKYHHNTVRIKNGQPGGEPKNGGIVARAELDKGLYYIYTKAFRKHLRDASVNLDECLDELEKRVVLIGRMKRKRLAAGLPGTQDINVTTYEFKVDPSKMASDDEET